MNNFPQMLHDSPSEKTLLGILLNPTTKIEQYDTIEGYIKQIERFTPFFIDEDNASLWSAMKFVRVTTNNVPSLFSMMKYQKFHPQTTPEYLTENPKAKGTFDLKQYDATSLSVYYAQRFISILAECARRRFIQLYGQQLMNAAVDPSGQQFDFDRINKFKEALTSSYYVSTDKVGQLAESCLIDFSQKEEKPTYWLTYQGRGFCVKGGISAFSGKAKKGKTQFLMLMTSTLVSGEEICGLKANEKPKRIAWIDTEQKTYSIQGNFGRLMRTLGKDENPSTYGIDVYTMRYNTIQERKDVIQWLAAQKNKPDIIVIDGLLDLCFNMNDMAESHLLIQMLMQLTKDDITVLVVLHENEGQDSEKMSGALGSELERKYDDKFSISKKNDTFSVKHTSRNNMSIPKYEFHITHDGYEEGPAVEEENDETDMDIAYQGACEILAKGPLKYSDLASKLAARIGKSVKIARNRMKDLRDSGRISYDEVSKTYRLP